MAHVAQISIFLAAFSCFLFICAAIALYFVPDEPLIALMLVVASGGSAFEAVALRVARRRK